MQAPQATQLSFPPVPLIVRFHSQNTLTALDPGFWMHSTTSKAQSLDLKLHQFPPWKSSNVESVTHFPRNFISSVSYSLRCSFLPERRQPPSLFFFFLSINLLYEVCHSVWLWGIPWPPAARIPFHLSCNANNYERSLVFLSTYRLAKIVKQWHPHTNTKNVFFMLIKLIIRYKEYVTYYKPIQYQ